MIRIKYTLIKLLHRLFPQGIIGASKPTKSGRYYELRNDGMINIKNKNDKSCTVIYQSALSKKTLDDLELSGSIRPRDLEIIRLREKVLKQDLRIKDLNEATRNLISLHSSMQETINYKDLTIKQLKQKKYEIKKQKKEIDIEIKSIDIRI